MQRIFITLGILFSAIFTIAQDNQYKIVFDLSSSDTSVQSTVLRQFNNVLKEAPQAQLEVVCHGQAIFMLANTNSYFEEKIKELKSKGNVSFKVCANSMKRFNVDKSALMPMAEIVPVAILELSGKQMKGWSYIKAGH